MTHKKKEEWLIILRCKPSLQLPVEVWVVSQSPCVVVDHLLGAALI